MFGLLAEGGIALLDVNPGLVIWTTVTFFIVFIVLKVFAWKPIAQALDARAEKIHADIDRAESIRKEAEDKLKEYMSKLDGLRSEGQEIISEAKRDAERVKDEILATARKESEAIKTRNLRDLGLAADAALEKLHLEVANLSVAVAAQVIGKTINPEDHKKFIQETIEKLKSMN